MSNQERLTEVEAMLAACSASITKLLGKTSQSVSFGGQTYSLVDVEKLTRVRDRLLIEEDSLKKKIAGTKRRTIKVYFPPSY
jgi:hypothetical protein